MNLVLTRGRGSKIRTKLADVIHVCPLSGGNSGGGTKDDLSTASESAFVRARASEVSDTFVCEARARERGEKHSKHVVGRSGS